jgi:hypothetical protein
VKLVRVRRSDHGFARLKVYVLTRRALGAYTFQVSFDPSVLKIENIEAGTEPAFTAPVCNPAQFASGRTRFSAFQNRSLDRPLGAVHVATLVFGRGQGPPSTRRTALQAASIRRAPVEVQAITLAETDGARRTARARTRTVTLRP